MPNFDQAKREAAKKELHTLFKGVASNKVAKIVDIAEARQHEVTRSEFCKLNWADLERVMGKGVMADRFLEAAGNLDAVWLALDTNQNSTVTPEEFLAECLDEPYCSYAEALEAYEILRDQNEFLPVADLGKAIRAIGMNPTQQQVMEMAHKYDTNADGDLDRDEWKCIVDDMMKFPKDDRKTLMAAFEKVSKGEKKGIHAEITTEELVFVATKLGHGLDVAEVKAMVDVVDANSDGHVQFEEFVAMVQKLPAYVPAEM
eukprot:m.31493 g.31493  ORF g.31493 m.31493 type:complete len:259 (+) comp6936_c0_seq2:233-1009(+)